MAATKAEHAIHVRDTLASEAGSGGGQDPATETEQPLLGCCWKAIMCLVGVVMVALFVLLLVTMAIELSLDWPPEYSAALAAAAPGSIQPAPTNVLSAPFNLTVHIKNPSRLYSYCVWSDAAAVVTYGGATIGAGTVPSFCAGKEEEREVAAPVWGAGAGADVTLPGALQSSGAVVDVALRVPRSPACSSQAQVQVLACSVKVGRGLSLCTSSCAY